MVALSLAKMSRPSRGVGHEGIIRKVCEQEVVKLTGLWPSQQGS